MRAQTGTGVHFAIMGAIMLSLFTVGSALAPTQLPPPPRSPRDVLASYRKLDEEGGRLTTNGWYAASKFFVKPARSPEYYVLAVIGGERIEDGFPLADAGNEKSGRNPGRRNPGQRPLTLNPHTTGVSPIAATLPNVSSTE